MFWQTPRQLVAANLHSFPK